MKLIVGLGNPGKKYANTRHNLGFMVVDELAKKWNLKWRINKRLKAEILHTGCGTGSHLGIYRVVLAKPLTFMNNSGLAVKKLVNFNKLNNFNNLYIIHDDVDLALGKIKVVRNRGAAGHHGVESVIQHLGSKDFHRVRLGIGRIRNSAPTPGESTSNTPGEVATTESLPGGDWNGLPRGGTKREMGRQYVLTPFTVREKPIVQKMIKEAVEITVGMAGSAPAASASRTQHSN